MGLFRRYPVVLMALIIMAIASSAVGAKVITLELWHGITGGDYSGLKELMERFNLEYAGRYEVRDMQMNWGTHYDKLQVAAVSGVAPDVAFVHQDRLPEMVEKNILRPLDDLWEEAGWTERHFLPAVAPNARWNGAYYGVPLDVYTHLLFYNRDHFDEVGIAAPPTNPEEFVTQAKKLTRKVGDQVQRWGTHLPWDPTRFYNVLYQYGANTYAEDKRTVVLDSPEAVAATEFVWKLAFEYRVAPALPAVPSMWKGEVSMFLDGIWSLKPAQENREKGMVNLQVARADSIYGSARKGIRVGTHEMTIPKQKNEDPERLEAAKAFVRFVSDNNIIWAEHGQLPVRRDAIGSSRFAQLSDHLIIADQSFVYLPSPPWGYGWGALDTLLKRVADPGRKDHMAAEGAVQLAAETLRNEVKTYYDNLSK